MYVEAEYRNAGRFVTPVREVKRINIPVGDAGVRITINEMRKMVRETVGVPVFKDIALRMVPTGQIVLGMSAYTQLYASLKQAFRYVPDTAGIEEIWKPDCHAARFLGYGYTWGDCDDAAVWAATMVTQLNLGDFRWVTIANGVRGDMLNHVFIEVLVNSEWRTLDFLSPRMKRVRTVYWRG